MKPLPDLAAARAGYVGYRAHAIDTASAVYDEPLVDLHALGLEGVNYYARADNPPYFQRFPGAIEGLFLRRGVAAKLKQVDDSLRSDGLKLFIHDAWRPTAVQAFAHDVWMPGHLQSRMPHLEGAALWQEVERYWAAPTVDATSPSPHYTGAAVDLTIVSQATGHELFMGSIFDDVSALAHTDHYESRPLVSYSDEEALANRRRLYWLMTEAGFASHPYEWWHFSHGDQMWARLGGHAAALYGGIEP